MKTLNLQDTLITEIKGLENLTNLHILDFRGNQITEIKGLETLINLTRLTLSNNQISKIKGFEKLTNLQELWLDRNQISEIEGLETSINLWILNLGYNQISEIKGLESLTKLTTFYLKENQIPQDLLNQLGGVGKNGFAKSPQNLVEYCRKKREKEEKLEKESLEKIKKIIKVSTRIKLDMLIDALKMDTQTFNEKIFEWAEKFGFTIDGDYLITNIDTVSDFIDELDKQFAIWEKSEREKIKKI